MAVCPKCGNDFKALHLHEPHCKAGEGAVAVAVRNELEPAVRSERGRRRRDRDMQVLTPLEQIRARPSATTGPWAYYIHPAGATIRDALILYPNGAKLPREEDPRGKFSENADYYQARQRAKGLEYVGPTLTPDGVRRLVEVLRANRDDEILDLEDQIAACEHDITNSDRPEWRDNQRKRRQKLLHRLEYVRNPPDPEALIAELNEIARAQRMARVSPEVMTVMREMLGEVKADFAQMVSRFQSTKTDQAEVDAFTGVDRIEE